MPRFHFLLQPLLLLGVAVGGAACQTPADTAVVGESADVQAQEDAQLADDVDAAAILQCVPCVDRSTCGTGWCVQFAADSYCAADCTNSACASGLSCELLTTESGDSVHACVPPVDTCSAGGGDVDASVGLDTAPADTAPADTVSGTCASLDGPETASCCKACTAGANCQANHCFGGWFCDPAACKCVPAPTGGACVDAVGGGDTVGGADAASGPDASDPQANDLTAAGGKLDALVFAIVGDTRPATIDGTASYPSAIAAKIWQGVQAHNVPFAVTTGDYLFATAWGSQGAPQLDKYLAAASGYTGLRLPALGNHECTGATTSNCGAANKDGLPKNYTAYLEKMLAPLGLTLPYYAFHVADTNDNWTAKFVFVAANAWDAQQAAWLDAEMAKPTTYTFVVRHEPVAADTAPGVNPSEAIINKYPVTIRLVGHTHTYVHKEATREVVIGNGGAPLTNTVPYGYAIATRRPDDAIEIKGYDYSTGKVFSTFAVNADGTPAP